MWIPHNLLAPLKAESPKPTILASEADSSERDFVVGFYLRNPVTRSWDCDVLVSASDGPRKIEIAGRLGKIQFTSSSAGKLEQIIYTLRATGPAAALSSCYADVIRRLDSMILQYGRGIEVAGWQIADIAHEARWRCVPFRPSTLMPSPDLRNAPAAFNDVMRLYREARCTMSPHWRLICAGAILNAAAEGAAPFDTPDGEMLATDSPLVTTDMLIRSGAIVSHIDLKGGSLNQVCDRIEPLRSALLNALLTPGSSSVGNGSVIATDFEAVASVAALANLADLIARDLILERLRESGCIPTSPEIGREPLALAGQLAGLS
jgi:hypothetical protein